ncbi:Phosphatidyl-N-methylethanolamine N-methyltransferase [Rhizoctonia solani]|uniref:Phosphatidyl-N-methylethanolamine N-methyltransferase n=1 Tax=Rhizoctonia solani TaxID=456999 RepID=A0A8H7I3V1_9AGAM|nr:Phosphatidyl-N-methylethanolamine N-methyltransferase [Rhizoctonia solani]
MTIAGECVTMDEMNKVNKRVVDHSFLPQYYQTHPTMSQVDLASFVDFNKRSFWVSVGTILWNPLFWNCVAQNEYHNKTITKTLRGNRYLGCYLLAITIFSLGMFRDAMYHNALKEQPASDLINPAIAKPLAASLFVPTKGTFLGDYFGILMSERVTGFPLQCCGEPDVRWSTMCFAATALWYSSPAGLLLTLLVHIVYSIALRYEGPFTTMIYSRAAKQSKAQ